MIRAFGYTALAKFEALLFLTAADAASRNISYFFM